PPRGPILSVAFGADARSVSGAVSLWAPPVGSIGLGSVFGPPVGDRRLPRSPRPRRIPFGRLTPLPTPPPKAARPPPVGSRSASPRQPCGSLFGLRAEAAAAVTQHHPGAQTFPHPPRRSCPNPFAVYDLTSITGFRHVSPQEKFLGRRCYPSTS